MITEAPTNSLSSTERSQFDQIELARGAWKEGRADGALLIIGALKDSSMTPRVAAECYVAEAGFFAERGDFKHSLESLEKAAPHIDAASVTVRGSFYFQRGRGYKELHDYSSALIEYSGAGAVLEATGDNSRLGAVSLNLAGCYLALGDLDAAQTNITQALKLLEASKSFYLPQAYDTKAKILLADGDLESAANSIRQALEGVGENEKWRAEFLATQEQIEIRLLAALQVEHLSDWHRVKLNMVRRALQDANGSPAEAAKVLGVTRHAVFSLVKTHKEELEPHRSPKRVRHKTIIKKN